MREANLLPYVLPEIVPMAEDTGEGRHKNIWLHTLRVIDQSPPRLALRWAALLHDAAKPMTRSIDDSGEVHFFGHERLGAGIARRTLRRLKQERALIDRVAALVDLHLRPAGYDQSWTDSAVRRIVFEAGDLLDDLLDLVAADVTSARADRQREAARRIQGLREHIQHLREQHALDQLQSPLDGNELMEIFNRPPGRWIGQVKDYLRDMVLDGTLEPGDKATALEEAKRWIAEQSTN
jgi:poly(A) polymerase